MLRIANHIDDNPDDLQYGDPKVKTVMVAGFMRQFTLARSGQ